MDLSGGIVNIVYCPVIAAESRKLVAEGLFRMISVVDLPRGMAVRDRHNRFPYFGTHGTAAAYDELVRRVRERLADAREAQTLCALTRAMAPVY